MLKKSTLREIKTSLARYLAIFSIVALGVGFFAGLKDCKASMVSTAQSYLEGHNFFDYQIATSYGIDDDSVEIARSWEGVSGAEGSIQLDVTALVGDGDAKSLRAINVPEEINTLSLVKGRMPESPDECLADDYSNTDAGYSIGDTIVLSEENDKDTLKNFNNREFTIVGTVNTPIFLDYQRGSTDIGNGRLDSFFFIPKEAFDVDYYTQLYLTLEGDELSLTEELDDKLKSKEDSMEDLADAVNDARRETARKEAQEELDEKKQEYEDKLAEYEQEKADAEAEINDAHDLIDKGSRKIAATRKDLNKKIKQAKSAIATLEDAIGQLTDGKSQAEAGLAQAQANKTQMEQQLSQLKSSGLDDEETLAAIAQLEAGIQSADAAITELQGTISGLDSQLAEAEEGLKTAKSGLALAQKGLKTLNKEENKLEDSEATLREEEAKAETEFEKARKKLDDAKEKLDDAQDKIDEMETGNSYALSRNDNSGYSSFDSNSSIVSNIAKIFPVFFFLIAALVCMTTMTRMADEQRTQIGILKALGYSNSQIVAKYMFYSGSGAFMGAVVGFFAGCKIFPAVIWHAYTMMYDFSKTVDYVIDYKLGIISLSAALICSMGATWVSISQDFKVPPAELIRPKTPPAGKRILLERITPLWKRISFLYKVSFRNVFRDKKRFLMMVIGVSGCTALLIAGMGIDTTVAKVADHQFEEISLYDYMAVFSKNMNEDRQKDFLSYMQDDPAGAELTEDDVLFVHRGEVTVETPKGNTNIICTASDPDGFGKFIDLHDGDTAIPFPGKGEVVIVRKLNHDYGIKAGDVITLRDGYREMEVTVSSVCDNYVNDSIYISKDTYEKGFGKAPSLKAAYIMVKGGAEGEKAEEAVIRDSATLASNYDHTAAVSVNVDVRENVAQMMKSLNAVVFVVVLSAALLAFIVLFNLTNINITERIREIATIKVLGFNQWEVTQYVFRENMFLTVIAAIVGIPMGKWLLEFVIDNIVVKMIYFEARLTNMNIASAVILTFVFAAVVNLAMQRRLARVSMTESLKSVE